MKAARSLACAATVAAIVAAPGRAGAKTPTDEKIACIQSFERGQRARQDGRLTEARDDLLVCARPACPALVRKDCSAVLDAVDAALPTIVVIVRDASGAEITDAVVTVDGAPLSAARNGRAVAMDPGQHGFHVTARGGAPLDERVIVHEAEKDRTLVFVLDPAPAGAPVAAPPPPSADETARANANVSPPPPARREPMAGGHTTVPWIVAGVGALVAIGGFVWWRVGQNDVADGQAICPGGVCKTDADKARSDDLQQSGQSRTYVGAGFAAGGLAVAVAGVVWHFLEPPAHPVTISRGTPTSPYLSVPRLPEVGPVLGRGYGGVAYTERFF